MGKKSKIGKQRKDKFYHLAKETGYRSRAAFKLIQLNRKFEFLQNSRVCVDLCAAPGGWMQVARENMPVSSIVIGVDLFPIKPIAGCISLIEDITTDKCRVAITKELKLWKADVVLNDGAPNVGKNWLFDAFQQATLTLSAIKLAAQLLRSGGWFITKVFRSRDYQALVWVLKQLFKKVYTTKPQASRNESAEIFIVCQYYIAPDKIDPKFFDPKYVFSELEIEPSNKLNLLQPEKKKRKAEGYPENDYTLHHKLPASDFIKCKNGIEILQTVSEIFIDDEKIANHPKTSKEIVECCKDIKVLGRKDLRSLLTWWKELHNEFYVKVNDESNSELEKIIQNPVDVDNEESEASDEETLIDSKIAELKADAARELKRKQKKARKERLKLNERLNLKMVHKGDEGPKLEDSEMFTLNEIRTHEILNAVTDQSPDFVAESDTESNDGRRVSKKVFYEKGAGSLSDSGAFYEYSSEDNSSLSENSDAEDSGNDESETSLIDRKKLGKKCIDETELEDEPYKNPLLTDLDHGDKSKRHLRANLWFEKDIFKKIENEGDEDFELDKMMERHKLKKSKTDKTGANQEENEKASSSSDSDYDPEEFITGKDTKKIKKNNKAKSDNFEVVSKETPKESLQKRKLSEQDLALGSLLITSKKSRRDLIDHAWNRYAFNDEHLPDWFVQDENKHMKNEIPAAEEFVSQYKKRFENLNVRPIKKVMEAKARKKMRAVKKLERAKKKIETLVDNADITDKEKASQIKSLYNKARKRTQEKITYVVAKKNTAQKRAVRPPGIKGRYKMVDPRMKKDMRAANAKKKTNMRSKKGKK